MKLTVCLHNPAALQNMFSVSGDTRPLVLFDLDLGLVLVFEYLLYAIIKADYCFVVRVQLLRLFPCSQPDPQRLASILTERSANYRSLPNPSPSGDAVPGWKRQREIRTPDSVSYTINSSIDGSTNAFEFGEPRDTPCLICRLLMRVEM